MSRYCPRCNYNTETVKIGRTSTNRQRYRCKNCKKTWTAKPHPQRLARSIWCDYAIEDLRITQLCKKYNLGKDNIRKILSSYNVTPVIPSGKHDVIGMDCTYFGRRGINEWGVLIIIDAITGESLYCEEVLGHETWAHYIQALKYLESHNVHPKACIIDGIPGLAGVLELQGLVVQYCQFHQIKTIIGYLTRNPILEPNIELKNITLELTHRNRKDFITIFNTWYYKHQLWLQEKTRNPDTGRLEYSHQKTRSAVHSLRRNFKYLYTYEQYPDFQIPNTNNKLEGINSAIKSKLNHHRGINKQLKIKLIRTFLSSRTEI